MQRASEMTSHTPPTVSVVVPTLNRLGTLRKCLDALAVQTCDSYEVVVVDDASTDDTLGLLESFATEHPTMSLRWLRNEERRGANASRTRAIEVAAGRYVAFLDSDCVAREDWLDKLLAGFDDDRVAAVTGLVVDPPPSNIYELTFKGTHRVDDVTEARRLVAGNMCIRRDLLLAEPLDQDLLYGCDEEGVFLRLKAAGYAQRVAADAVVLHEHYYNRASFFRQARVGGASAAWLVYKYYLPTRLDLLPFILAYLSLPLAFIRPMLATVPAFFFLAAFAALAYNDLFRKKKTLVETLKTFPVLLVYYQVRLAGYLWQSLRLRLFGHDVKRIRLAPTE